MKTIKVVKFPGETREFAVEPTMTVGEVLGIAGIEVDAESAITADGETVELSAIVANMNLIAVTKRLKGAR